MFARSIIKGQHLVLGALWARSRVLGLAGDRRPALRVDGRDHARSTWSAWCACFCTVVKNALGYDDALDVFGVHCIGGIVGALGPLGILVAGEAALGGTGIIDYTTGKIASYSSRRGSASPSSGASPPRW